MHSTTDRQQRSVVTVTMSKCATTNAITCPQQRAYSETCNHKGYTCRNYATDPRIELNWRAQFARLD